VAGRAVTGRGLWAHRHASGETTVSTFPANCSARATWSQTSPAMRNSHRVAFPTRKACTGPAPTPEWMESCAPARGAEGGRVGVREGPAASSDAAHEATRGSRAAEPALWRPQERHGSLQPGGVRMWRRPRSGKAALVIPAEAPISGIG
jgi:hypothetical protein